MNERTQRFRIGLFVLTVLVLLGGLILAFGGLPNFFRRVTTYTVRFPEAPGLSPGAPVRRSGVRIGEVREVLLDEERGIVRATLAIDPPFRLRRNDQAVLVTNLLGGEASIDFVPQEPEGGVPGAPPADRTPLEPGAEI